MMKPDSMNYELLHVVVHGMNHKSCFRGVNDSK